MIITGCGQHDSVNESAQAISLRQQLCVNVSLQTELKDGLAAYYLCSSSFLIHRRLRLFLMVVVVLRGILGGLLLIFFPVWPVRLCKYNECRNLRQKKTATGPVLKAVGSELCGGVLWEILFDARTIWAPHACCISV